MVSANPPSSAQPNSSRHRPSTAPTPSSKTFQIDTQSIKRPPSALHPSTETMVSPSPSQGSHGVVSCSSIVSGSSSSHSRASYMSTGVPSPSTRSISVVLEVEAETEDAGAEDAAAQSRKSAVLSPKSTVAPDDNSWYVANEYSETPKFSRLGLAGSNVVMPVSAKERKKQISQRYSVASFQSNNGAGKSLTKYSSTTSDPKERNGTIKLSWSNNRHTVADISPQEDLQTACRTHKPEWLKVPPTHTRSRRISLPSPTPTAFSSAASSASSLPLTIPPHSGTSSTPSVVSFATACTSVDESKETTKEDDYPYPRPMGISPVELENKLGKRKSVLAMVKSWRSTPPHSDPSSDAGVSSESTQSAEKNPGVVYIEPLLSSKTNYVKKSDVVVTSVPKSHSESTIQVIPGSGKRDRKVGTVRKIWNTLTGRSSRI